MSPSKNSIFRHDSKTHRQKNSQTPNYKYSNTPPINIFQINYTFIPHSGRLLCLLILIFYREHGTSGRDMQNKNFLLDTLSPYI